MCVVSEHLQLQVAPLQWGKQLLMIGCSGEKVGAGGGSGPRWTSRRPSEAPPALAVNQWDD